MDITLVIIGFIFAVSAVFSSLSPVLPGIPMSWTALLLLHLTKAIPNDWRFLGITGTIALLFLHQIMLSLL